MRTDVLFFFCKYNLTYKLQVRPIRYFKAEAGLTYLSFQGTYRNTGILMQKDEKDYTQRMTWSYFLPF